MNNFWLNRIANRISFGQLAEWDSSIEETDFIYFKRKYIWFVKVK